LTVSSRSKLPRETQILGYLFSLAITPQEVRDLETKLIFTVSLEEDIQSLGKPVVIVSGSQDKKEYFCSSAVLSLTFQKR